MDYVKAIEGVVEQFPYTVYDLRADNPNTSFPKNMTEEQLSDNDMFPVIYGQPPYHDEATQKLVQQTEPVLTDGSWIVGWDIVDKTQGEIVADTENQKEVVRTKRNSLLAESDWTQLPDTPLSPEDKSLWVSYRQSLRDVTGQEGFPYNIIWPEAP
jgi:hypothetical protein